MGLDKYIKTPITFQNKIKIKPIFWNDNQTQCVQFTKQMLSGRIKIFLGVDFKRSKN